MKKRLLVKFEKKNRKAFLAGNVIVNLIVAVLVIVVLVSLIVGIYNRANTNADLKIAKSEVQKMVVAVSSLDEEKQCFVEFSDLEMIASFLDPNKQD